MLTLDIMRHVDRQKYIFYFCSLSGLSGQLDEEIKTLGGKVFPLKLDARFCRRFLDLLNHYKFDVIHSHVHMFSGFILSLAAYARVPVRIAHFHSMTNSMADRIYKKIQNKIMQILIKNHATEVIAVCEGVMEFLWGKEWEKCPKNKVIYNGIVEEYKFYEVIDRNKVRAEFGISNYENMYIHVGRMDPPKNHIRLISIFKKIIDIDNKATLLLVGKGNNEIEFKVRSLIHNIGLKDKVYFAGVRNDVPRLLKAADLMILPSLWEGLPGVVLEACAAGTSVLASDLPGVREIASKIPSRIICLPLAANDIKWAQTAVDVGVKGNRKDIKDNERHSLIPQIFTIERQTNELIKIWNSK